MKRKSPKPPSRSRYPDDRYSDDYSDRSDPRATKSIFFIKTMLLVTCSCPKLATTAPLLKLIDFRF